MNQYFVEFRSKNTLAISGYMGLTCSVYKVVKEVINFMEMFPCEMHVKIVYLKNNRRRTLLEFDTDKSDKRNINELVAINAKGE